MDYKNNQSIESGYFDRDYFEFGAASGKSLYENYRWMPDLTIPLAEEILRIIRENHESLLANDGNFLDFGCAKGFLVKAFREIGVNCFGVDISEYAINCAPPDVKNYVCKVDNNLHLPDEWPDMDWIIAKDVLEHFPYSEIDAVIEKLRGISSRILAVIPMGDGEKYYIPEYENDKSHFIREDLHWWTLKLESYGFNIESSYSVGSLKASWANHDEKGNGLFVSVD